MTEPCVLLVEPDVLVRHPLAEYLRECGFAVLEAQDAEEAKSLLEKSLQTVDVMLVEGEAGFALVQHVRRHHPDIECILAGTVLKATELAGDLCQDGPALTKPYEHRFVLDRIRRLLAARSRRQN